MIRKNGTSKVYRIVVQSELSDRYAVAFEGMQMEAKNGRTILTGEVKDQPHLFGILDRLNGLVGELAALKADATHWLEGPEYAVLRYRLEAAHAAAEAALIEARRRVRLN